MKKKPGGGASSTSWLRSWGKRLNIAAASSPRQIGPTTRRFPLYTFLLQAGVDHLWRSLCLSLWSSLVSQSSQSSQSSKSSKSSKSGQTWCCASQGFQLLQAFTGCSAVSSDWGNSAKRRTLTTPLEKNGGFFAWSSHLAELDLVAEPSLGKTLS